MTNCGHGRIRVLLLAAALWFMQLSAAAQQSLESRVARVHWQAPAGCPTRADVERLLVRVDSSSWSELEGAIQRAGSGFRLRLRVRGHDRSFERELRADKCEVLAESTVWLVELANSQLSAAQSGATGSAPAQQSASANDSSRADRLERLAPDDESALASDSARGANGSARAERLAPEDGSARASGSVAVDRSASVSGAGPAMGAGRARVPAPASEDDESIERGARDAAAEVQPAAADTSYLNAGVPDTTHNDSRAGGAAAGGDDAASGSHFRVGFGAAAVDAGLSGLSPHLALDLMLVLAHWTLGLRLGALLHPELNVAGGARVDLQTNAAQLLGCKLWDVAKLSIGPCLAVSALHTAARTTGLTGSEYSSASWLAAGPSIVLQARVTSAVRVSGELGAWATLTPRPSFEVSGTSVARAGTLAGYARLGASYELW